MWLGRVGDLDDLEGEDAVAAGGVGVQLGGGELEVLPPDHQGLVRLVCAHHLGTPYIICILYSDYLSVVDKCDEIIASL